MKPNSEDMNGSVEDIGVELTEKIYAATTTPILGPQTNSTEPNEGRLFNSFIMSAIESCDVLFKLM